MTRITLLIGFLTALFAVLIGFPVLVELITDWWWFGTVGYETVFTRRLVTKLALGVGAGAAAFLFLYGNLRLAQRGLVPIP